MGWSYQLFGCRGVKERRFVGQHMFPPVALSNPCGWTPPLCLISPVNNCSGFSSHHWYSNQCLLWAKQQRGPSGQLPGVFQCVCMQGPARKGVSALLKTLWWRDAHTYCKYMQLQASDCEKIHTTCQRDAAWNEVRLHWMNVRLRHDEWWRLVLIQFLLTHSKLCIYSKCTLVFLMIIVITISVWQQLQRWVL